jgi:hypothetical protein
MTQWGPIQLIPPGLLGLLQLKNIGKNPSQLLDEVRPIMDILPMWYEAVAEELSGFSRTPVTGNNGFASWTVPQIVPQGEIWWVMQYTVVTSEMGVGDSGQFGVGWQLPSVNHTYAVGDISAINSGVGRCIAHGEQFFLPPGGELLWFTNDVVNATAFTLNGFARIARLPI